MVVDRFFIWVAEATSEQKLGAVDALVAAYFDARLGEDDREALEAALMLVAEDADLAVRRRLAEVLADEDAAPRHLLLALLDDHPSVAVPIAARSEALIDAELVDVVAHGSDAVRLAVAGRRRVGPTVSVALAEAGDRAACVALLANLGAEIPPIALERVVERFGEFSEIRKALLARPHVPITIRHRVLEKLAEAIENLVVVKSWMGPEKAGSATRESREKATVALAGNATAAETVVLVEHLRRTGQLTTRLMLRAACVGDLRFVEEALALLADVPTTRVAALVADGRESAIRALYRRASMPDRAWPAFHAAIEVHRELLAETGGFDGRPGDRARFSRRLVERVLTRFTAFERRDADDLLVLLRRYAADAAREHVRSVMEERMADVSRALAPPAEASVPATAEPATAPADAVMGDLVDAAVLDAVAAELGVSLTDAEPAAIEAAETAPAPAAPTFDFVDASTLDLDEVEEFGGLFAHVRPEDLPAEWLTDEVAAEALWGDEEIAVRRAITPDLRLVVDDLPPLSEGWALRGGGDVVAPVEEAVAEPVDATDAADVAADADPFAAAEIVETTSPAVIEAMSADETPAEGTEATADDPLPPAELAASAPAEAVELAGTAVAETAPQAATTVAAPAERPLPSGDAFIDELEAALDAILGPAPTRRAA